MQENQERPLSGEKLRHSGYLAGTWPGYTRERGSVVWGGSPIEVTLLALPDTSPTNLLAPAEVFAEANKCFCPSNPPYRVRVLTVDGRQGAIPFAGSLHVGEHYVESWDKADTLLVAGGLDWSPFEEGGRLIVWLREKCKSARRFGSLCSGTALLAEAGLLDGRKATAHWSLHDEMSQKYPKIRFLPDRIFVRDDNCYTSAGAAAAIDLALCLVAEDLGDGVAQEVARRMLVFLRKPEAHPQISATIRAQRCSNGAIRELLPWMADNLNQDLCVAKLAQRVAMSPRSFARHFTKEVGKTPGQHVSELRLEAAKGYLTNRALVLKEVALASGLKSPTVLRRVFMRFLGISPGEYRRVMR